MTETAGGGTAAPASSMPERKGRFKIKEVDAAEVREDVPRTEAAAIVGCRIKGAELEEGKSMSRHGSEASIALSHTGDIIEASATSTSSTSSKPPSGKEVKKGRFVIRELPEDLTDVRGASPVPSHPGTPQSTPSGHHHPQQQVQQQHHHPLQHPQPQSSQHHVQIDPQVYLHQLPAKPPVGSSSKPPLHPPLHPPDTPLSASAASDHYSHAHSSTGGSGRSPEFILYHTGSFSSAPSPLTGSINSSGGNEFGFTSYERTFLDAESARLIRQQNELILAKLQQLEKVVTVQHHHAPTAGGGDGKRDLVSSTLSKSSVIKDGDSLGRSDTGSSSKDTTTGKLNYHLEQMKTEVEAATAKRKELDMQMKRLQEKNRVLEEKVDEEKSKRVLAEKKVEKYKEKYDQLAAEVQHLQEQLAAYQQQQPPPQQQQQAQSQQQQQQQQTPSSPPPQAQQQQHSQQPPQQQPPPPQQQPQPPGQQQTQPPPGQEKKQQQQQPPPGSGSSSQQQSHDHHKTHTPSGGSGDFDFMSHVAAPIPKPHAADLSMEELQKLPPPRMTASPAPQRKPSPGLHHEGHMQGRGSLSVGSGGDPFNALMSLSGSGGGGSSFSSNPGSSSSHSSHARNHSAPPAPANNGSSSSTAGGSSKDDDDAFSELVSRKQGNSTSSSSAANKGASSSSRSGDRNQNLV